MSGAPMNEAEVLAMAAGLAVQYVTGVTSSGPTTKRHRGSGASLRAVDALTVADVGFARDWALSSGMASAIDTTEAPALVPIVLPGGEVTRADPRTLNTSALTAAQLTAAAEVAVLLGILRRRVQRIAALERLRGAAEQVEAPGGSETA